MDNSPLTHEELMYLQFCPNDEGNAIVAFDIRKFRAGDYSRETLVKIEHLLPRTHNIVAAAIALYQHNFRMIVDLNNCMKLLEHVNPTVIDMLRTRVQTCINLSEVAKVMALEGVFAATDELAKYKGGITSAG